MIGGLGNALPGADALSLGASSGLGGATSGLGGATDALGGLGGGGGLGGLTGGLTGGGQGLNVAGLVGIGSDEAALLDLNPAKKKAQIEKEEKMKTALNQKHREEQQALKKELDNKTITQEQYDQRKQQLDLKQKQEGDQLLAQINQDRQQLLQEQSTGNASAGGLTNGLGGATSGLGGATNGLGGAANGLGGATNALGGASNGLGGLTGGNALGDLTGGLGGLGGVTGGLGGLTGGAGGLTGGLLPGDQGLNVAGVLGVGSNEDAILDLNPAKKKKQIEKEQQAVQQLRQKQERERQVLKQALSQNQISQSDYDFRQQQLAASHQQQAQTLKNQIQASRQETINEIKQQNTSSAGVSQGQHSGHCSGFSGLFHAYLVDTTPGQYDATPAYVLTFPSAAAADQWYQGVGPAQNVQRVSPQFYTYQGIPPHPVAYQAQYQNWTPGRHVIFAPARASHSIVQPQVPAGSQGASNSAIYQSSTSHFPATAAGAASAGAASVGSAATGPIPGNNFGSLGGSNSSLPAGNSSGSHFGNTGTMQQTGSTTNLQPATTYAPPVRPISGVTGNPTSGFVPATGSTSHTNMGSTAIQQPGTHGQTSHGPGTSRTKYTIDAAAQAYATAAKSQGNTRSWGELYQEALADLKSESVSSVEPHQCQYAPQLRGGAADYGLAPLGW